MAKFDRSKFKTSNSLAQQEKELASKIKSNSFNNSLPGWIEIKDDGDYLLRFWPTPVEDSYFMVPTMVHYLDMELDKWEDGELVLENGVPVREVRKGTVFNSRIHGNTEDDIVEAYIAFVQKLADDLYGEDKKKKKEYLKHILGYNEKGKYTGGITGVLDYVAYASLMKKNAKGEYVEEEFGRVRIKPSVRKQMLKLSAGEDGEEGLSTDPFSDPDDGFIVKITKDSVAGKKDPSNYYQVSWCSKNYVPVKWSLPEGFEDKYDDLQTLTETYENKYNAKDFGNAIDGLQRFDTTHKYGAFSYDSFMEICEAIAATYPDEDEEESQEKEESQEAEVAKEETVEETQEVEEAEIVEEVKGEAPFKADAKSSTGTVSAADKLKAMQEKLKKKS